MGGAVRVMGLMGLFLIMKTIELVFVLFVLSRIETELEIISL